MQPQDPYDPNQQPQPQPQPPVPPQPVAPADAPVVGQTPYPQQPAAVMEDPGKTLSLVGVIVAIFIPIVGIPLAAVGMSKSKSAGYSGKLGLAGIIVGAVSILLTLVLTVVVPLMLANSLSDKVKEGASNSLNSSSPSTDDSSTDSSSSAKPDFMKLGECITAKGVDPNDLDAYTKASEECRAETQ